MNPNRASYVSGGLLIALGIVLSNTVLKGAFIVDTQWTIPALVTLVIAFITSQGIIAASDWSSPTVLTERHRFHFYPQPPHKFIGPRGLPWVALPAGGRVWRKGLISPANFSISGARTQIVFTPARLWECETDDYPIVRGLTIRMSPDAVKQWLGVQHVTDALQAFEGFDPERTEYYIALWSATLHPDTEHGTETTDLELFEDLLQKDQLYFEGQQSKVQDNTRDMQRNWDHLIGRSTTLPPSRRGDSDRDREREREGDER
jgi:hypothetical protein